MSAKLGVTMMPIVSKVYCSASEVVLAVRRRPNVANGGGFVVADYCQRVVFSVDGCGVLGRKEELILRDGEGMLCFSSGERYTDFRSYNHKGPPINYYIQTFAYVGAIIEALSITRQWKGFTYFIGSHKLVFTLKEPNYSCFSRNIPIRISIESKECCTYGDFDVRGDFPGRSCSIVSSKGDIVAQIGVKKEIERVMASRDLYHVEIKAGMDQAFVFGVIAVLDYIYDGTTRC
ncbi:UNVERIFIED_CONTAM: protein LURP-one-related 6 [Sesamum calycinum]|uniref:Protein LURP-one-related 6 n=1 Tax=Sesamum calycinum TaxID=2727403 RepID=A0AAW2NWB0_9LAMI